MLKKIQGVDDYQTIEGSVLPNNNKNLRPTTFELNAMPDIFTENELHKQFDKKKRIKFSATTPSNIEPSLIKSKFLQIDKDLTDIPQPLELDIIHPDMLQIREMHFKEKFDPDRVKTSPIFKGVINEERKVFERLELLRKTERVGNSDIKEIVTLMAPFFKRYPGVTWSNYEKKDILNTFFKILHSSVPSRMITGKELDADLVYVYLTLVHKTGQHFRFQSCRHEFFPKDSLLLSDREMMLAAVKAYGTLLRFGPKQWLDDEEIVVAAMNQNGQILRDMCEDNDFQSDKALLERIVLIAVNHSGTLLKYVTPELKENREIVEVAVKNDAAALDFAGEYQKDKEMVLLAVKKSPFALQFAPEFLNDREVLTEALVPRQKFVLEEQMIPNLTLGE